MVWDFKFMTASHPLFVPHPKWSEPIGAEILESCLNWLDRCCEGELTDPRLLTTSRRQGSFLESGYYDCIFGQGIFFMLPGREPRFVTPAQYCVMVLLAVPGRDCVWWFDRSTKKDLPDEEQRYYLRYSHKEGIWGLRIFADAQPEEVVVQRIKLRSANHLGHKDLRPSNMEIRPRAFFLQEGKPMRRPYRGRQEAIDYAVAKYRLEAPGLSFSGSEYAALLSKAFLVMDELHSHEIVRKGVR